MRQFIERHPVWALVVLIAIGVALWLILATWPPGLEDNPPGGATATERKTKTATDETRIKHGLAAPGTPRPDSRGGLAATSGVQT